MKYYYKNGVEYARPVDVALELAQENIKFRTFQKSDLTKNLRQYAEKIEE